MTEKKRKVQSAIAEHIAKLSEAIFRVRGYSIDIDEIKDYIKTAISDLEETQLEILEMTYIDKLSNVGIAKELGYTIQQVKESFEYSILTVIKKSTELYIETEMKRLDSLNQLLDECIIKLKEI